MFDVLPSLVIERIQDYLFPFVIRYLAFRLLSYDFKNLIDQVINETPTEESINFRLWVILLYQGCSIHKQKLWFYSLNYPLSFNFFHSVALDGKPFASLRVMSLRGKNELCVSVTAFSLESPTKLSLIKNNIVLEFSNYYIKFNFIERTTKVFYQTFPIENPKSLKISQINLPQGYTFWFYHNDIVFARSQTNQKSLLIVDKNHNQSFINIPFDSDGSEHIRSGCYPLIFKRTRRFFQGFNPLTQQLCGYTFSRYRKWVYIGSNHQYDCFSSKNYLHVFNRKDSKQGCHQCPTYRSKKFMVLSDRILFSLISDLNEWAEIFFVNFNWIS